MANVFNSHTFLFYRVARHRREVVEPEIIQEKSDSEDERHRKRFGEEEESSEEEEELDEEVIIPSSYQKKKRHDKCDDFNLVKNKLSLYRVS